MHLCTIQLFEHSELNSKLKNQTGDMWKCSKVKINHFVVEYSMNRPHRKHVECGATSDLYNFEVTSLFGPELNDLSKAGSLPFHRNAGYFP